MVPFHWSFRSGMLAVSILCASGVTVSGKRHLRCDESGPLFLFAMMSEVSELLCICTLFCSFELLTDPAAALGQNGSILLGE